MGRLFLTFHVCEVEVISKVRCTKGVPAWVAKFCVASAWSNIIVDPERSGLVMKVFQEEYHEYLERKVYDKYDCFQALVLNNQQISHDYDLNLCRTKLRVKAPKFRIVLDLRNELVACLEETILIDVLRTKYDQVSH